MVFCATDGWIVVTIVVVARATCVSQRDRSAAVLCGGGKRHGVDPEIQPHDRTVGHSLQVLICAAH